MRRVRFKSLVISNFKAYSGRHALALDGRGLIYIVGENRVDSNIYGNGAAKSTLWDALVWCLYGRTTRGLRGPEVKPWRGGNPFVVVGLDIDDASYLVERGLNPNRFTINGKEAPGIESLLGMSFDLFINTVILPQGRDLFLDRSPSEKMALLSAAIGLDRWDKRSAAASSEADKLDGEASGFSTEKQTTEGALEELERHLKSTLDDSRRWNDDAKKKTQVSKDKLKKLQRELELKQRELDGADLQEDGALTEKRAAEAEARKLGSQIVELRGELAALTAAATARKQQLLDVSAELADISTAKVCSTCGQSVKPANLAKHKQHLERRKRALTKELSGDITVCEDAERVIADGKERLSRIESSIETFAQKATEAGDVVARLRPEVSTLRSQISEIGKEETNPHIARVAQLTKRKKALQHNLEDIEADLIRVQQEAERARFWIKGFKEIKLQLIEEVLQEMELVANGMIEEVGLVGWEMRFDIEKETKSGSVQRLINVAISSTESKGFVKWESWSGGENQRLKLVGALALSDVLLAHVGVDVNIEVLDEPAVYWSSEGVQELCAFLATRAKERDKTLFYIEHQAVESIHFDETICIVKGKDGAYIEEAR